MNYSVGQKSSKVSSSEIEANISDIDPFGKIALVSLLELEWGGWVINKDFVIQLTAWPILTVPNSKFLWLQEDELFMLMAKTLGD